MCHCYFFPFIHEHPVAGYLAHSATKWSRCSLCASMLVNHDADPVTVTLEQSVASTFTSFSALVDRGKLLVPSATAVDMTLQLCNVWKQIADAEDMRRKLMCSYNHRMVFVEVAAVCYDQDTFAETFEDGHSLLKLKRRMASALFSLFAGNIARDKNSEVHSKKRRHAGVTSRSQASDKRRKLSGGKKV